MLINYFKTAIRNLFKNKIFSTINILGLAIGLASFFFIIIYIFNELNYDKHHKNADKTFRLIMKADMSGNVIEAAVSGGPLGRILFDELPEVVRYTRLFQIRQPVLIKYNEKNFYQDNVFYADTSFFDVFSYEFLYGDPKTALIHPFSLVLTEQTAQKFFGDDFPIGKTIKWNNIDNYTVRGVIKNPKYNSHINFDLLASYSSLYQHEVLKNYIDNLFAFMTQNYVVLSNEALYKETENKFPEVIQKYMGDQMNEMGSKFDFSLQPITRIHLHSHLVHELESNGDINRIYIFSAIALLILIIACINFVNLSTAQSSARTLEVGIRKVFGANKGMLFRQFIGESIIISFLSLIIAYILIELFLPVFNQLTGIRFNLNLTNNWSFLLIFIVFAIFVGALSGCYPALYMSAFKPVKILKGNFFKSSGKSVFRNIMVIIQFTVSIVLICSTILIYKQLSYINNKDLGFHQKNMIIIPLRGKKMIDSYETIKSELKTLSGVKDVTASSSYLGNFGQRRGFYPEGTSRSNTFMILNLQVDHNYLDMMNIDFYTGRNFYKNTASDSNAVIINKALMDHLGWQDPVGKFIFIPSDTIINDYRLKVIGVTENFHFASLHEDVKPLLMFMVPNKFRYLVVKVNAVDEKSVLNLIQTKWEQLNPDTPFDYFFQETKFKTLYNSEQNMVRIFIYFTFLAIFIALLGLFGLSLFSSRQRTKEIGIRKILGSSVSQIISLLSGNFLKLILISSVIAIPIAWYIMDRWLQNFTFHTTIAWWVFGFSILITLLIAIITVSFQVYNSARKNPVDALRYE
jgi:putative ABC transport system permease protein